MLFVTQKIFLKSKRSRDCKNSNEISKEIRKEINKDIKGNNDSECCSLCLWIIHQLLNDKKFIEISYLETVLNKELLICIFSILCESNNDTQILCLKILQNIFDLENYIILIFDCGFLDYFSIFLNSCNEEEGLWKLISEVLINLVCSQKKITIKLLSGNSNDGKLLQNTLFSKLKTVSNLKVKHFIFNFFYIASYDVNVLTNNLIDYNQILNFVSSKLCDEQSPNLLNVYLWYIKNYLREVAIIEIEKYEKYLLDYNNPTTKISSNLLNEVMLISLEDALSDFSLKPLCVKKLYELNLECLKYIKYCRDKIDKETEI